MVSKKVMPILFADDSSLFVQGKDINAMTETLNSELTHIYNWVNANKLSLNIKKTNCMLFRSMRKQVLTDFQIKIAGKRIQKVEVTKFLGVIIDSKLSWIEHINFIRKKLAKAIGIIFKARQCLNSHSLISLYYSIVYPYLNYGIEVWGSVPKTHLIPLHTLQNRILRIISFSPRRHSSHPLFVRYKILDIDRIYVYKVALFMFKLQKKECPQVFNSMFHANSEYHLHDTRSKDKLHLPLFKSTFCQRFLKYKGVVIWNFLSDVLPIKYTIPTIKVHLKKYLLFNKLNFL